MKKNKDTDIRLRSLDDILQVLGIIESNGLFFKPDHANKQGKMISAYQLADILFHFTGDSEPEKMDWGRTIRNAKNMYNKWDKDFQIQGDRRGSYFVKKKNLEFSPTDLKQSSVYKLFLIFTLAFSTLHGNLHWDVLHQLLTQRFPLALMSFLNLAIEHRFIIKIDYKKDRTQSFLTYEAVPAKIVCKEGHWFLVIYEIKTKKWIQLLIHSIKAITPILDSIKQIRTCPEMPEFNLTRFYRNTFQIAKLDGIEPVEFTIKVPDENKDAIQRRRKEGKWEKAKDHWLWKVSTFDIDEIFSYVFRWNGVLEIQEPTEMRKLFSQKLLKMSKLYS